MPETVNEKILNDLIRHQIGVQRLTSSEVKQILVLLRRTEQKILARLGDADLTKMSHQQRVLKRIQEILKSGYREVREAVTASISGLATYEAQFQLGVITKAIPVRLDTKTPTPIQLLAAVKARPFQGRFLREVYRDVEVGAFRRVRDEIRTGFAEGRTTEQIVRAIRGTRAADYTDGILQQSRRAAATTVRTALNHTANVARSLTYERNSDIIDKVQYVATLDSKTTRICSALDGKTFEIGKGPRPPQHPACRSTTVPIVKSWKQLGIRLDQAPPGTRASLNGQVPATQTYDGFLRNQDVAFQNDVLGVKKATLFRKGELPIDRFVDTQGRELTLAELMIREAEAWERAGL